MEDMQIVDLYFARSEQAVAETAHKYGTYLFSIAHNILMNRPDAEEAVSDTYLGAWNSIPPHRPGRLSTYLGKITRRCALEKWKAHHAKKRGGGEVSLALEELGECITTGDTPPASAGNEGAYQENQQFSEKPAGNRAADIRQPLLVSNAGEGDCPQYGLF